MVLLVLALVAYVAATGLFLTHLAARTSPLAGWGLRALMVGIALHLIGKIVRAAPLGTLPFTDGQEALSGLALVVAVLFVWAAYRYRVPVLGAFATPLVVVTLAASMAFSNESGVVPEALRSAWFPVHLILAITADACFAVAGVASLAFLLQERRLKKKQLHGAFKLMPPMPVLEEMSHRFIMTGFLLLTLAIVAGSFFAKQMWGAYWSWDPKQCWTLVTWLLFAGILHARITVGWRGRRAAWLVVVAVVVMIVSMAGFNMVLPTRHAGAYDGAKNHPTLGAPVTP